MSTKETKSKAKAKEAANMTTTMTDVLEAARNGGACDTALKWAKKQLANNATMEKIADAMPPEWAVWLLRYVPVPDGVRDLLLHRAETSPGCAEDVLLWSGAAGPLSPEWLERLLPLMSTDPNLAAAMLRFHHLSAKWRERFFSRVETDPRCAAGMLWEPFGAAPLSGEVKNRLLAAVATDPEFAAKMLQCSGSAGPLSAEWKDRFVEGVSTSPSWSVRLLRLPCDAAPISPDWTDRLLAAVETSPLWSMEMLAWSGEAHPLSAEWETRLRAVASRRRDSCVWPIRWR